METRKSLGVEEKSSKLAMSNCFTWTGSQSSMMNLEEERESRRTQSGSGGENTAEEEAAKL